MIKLKTPYALLDNLLAEYTLGIVPSGLRPEEPGRHRRVQVQVVHAGKDSVFVKYDDYWGDKAFVDELHIQDFPDPSAQVNALQAGQVQTIDNLPYNLIEHPQEPGWRRSSSPSPAPGCRSRCGSTSSPFSDVRVRQAMRLIADRQQMIDQTP